MTVNDFLEATKDSRVFLIGELHQNPRDTFAVVMIMAAMIKAKRDIHIFVEYFDSRQNAVIQPFLSKPEFVTAVPAHDPNAGIGPEHVSYLIFDKQWPAEYFEGHAGTFQENWMHKQELHKIAAILIYANLNSLPVKGFDLPYDKKKHKGFKDWDNRRDTWMAMHLQSFLLHDKGGTAVCFVGAAHAAGIANGSRTGTMPLRKLVNDRIITLVPDFASIAATPDQAISQLAADDYSFRPLTLANTTAVPATGLRGG